MGKFNYYDGDKKNVSFPNGIKAIIGDELDFCGVKEVFSPESAICFPQKDWDEVETITMPDSVQVIGPKAFEGCGKLKSIIFSNNLEKIYLSAFLNCDSLKTIKLPKSIKEIQTWAFGNYELDDVYYEGTIFEFDSVDTHGDSMKIKKLHCKDCTVDFTQDKYYIDTLKFDGTVAAWKASMSDHWINKRSSKIICSDGIIEN